MSNQNRPVFKRVLELCHFLIWAATKRHDFDHFIVGMRPLVRVSFTINQWSSEFWEMRIVLCKPSFYYWVPWKAQQAYLGEFKISMNLEDDIPF